MPTPPPNAASPVANVPVPTAVELPPIKLAIGPDAAPAVYTATTTAITIIAIGLQLLLGGGGAMALGLMSPKMSLSLYGLKLSAPL
ncbi:hypothetical protein K6Y31_20150 [Motilimonas cestriensis]|uniref:Uncharacterized protein n=1 Tax=Motilimonas cestriensis TaxID=2742685 RepID=A0ABS8WFQ0_9GAMM|nr:hypothetical protein [Motilimonas cestriensis]MCE2597090.1 hypothetical protein [Motilimonas cestriensis]